MSFTRGKNMLIVVPKESFDGSFRSYPQDSLQELLLRVFPLAKQEYLYAHSLDLLDFSFSSILVLCRDIQHNEQSLRACIKLPTCVTTNHQSRIKAGRIGVVSAPSPIGKWPTVSRFDFGCHHLWSESIRFSSQDWRTFQRVTKANPSLLFHERLNLCIEDDMRITHCPIHSVAKQNNRRFPKPRKKKHGPH